MGDPFSYRKIRRTGSGWKGGEAVNYFKVGDLLYHKGCFHFQAVVKQTLLHNKRPMGVLLEVVSVSRRNVLHYVGQTLFYAYNTKRNNYGVFDVRDVRECFNKV
jgi:hypothetical protein